MKLLALGLFLISSLSHASMGGDKEKVFERLQFAQRTGKYPVGKVQKAGPDSVYIYGNNGCRLTFQRYSDGRVITVETPKSRIACYEREISKGFGAKELNCEKHGMQGRDSWIGGGTPYGKGVIMYYSPDYVIYAVDFDDMHEGSWNCKF